MCCSDESREEEEEDAAAAKVAKKDRGREGGREAAPGGRNGRAIYPTALLSQPTTTSYEGAELGVGGSTESNSASPPSPGGGHLSSPLWRNSPTMIRISKMLDIDQERISTRDTVRGVKKPRWRFLPEEAHVVAIEQQEEEEEAASKPITPKIPPISSLPASLP